MDPGLEVVRFEVLKHLEDGQLSGLYWDGQACNSFPFDIGLPKNT